MAYKFYAELENAIKGLGSSDSFGVEQFSERFRLYFPSLVGAVHVCACLSAFKRVLEVRGNESDRGISKCATWPLNGALLKRCSPLEQVEKAVQPACLKRHFILKLQSCGGLAEPVGNRAGGCKRK